MLGNSARTSSLEPSTQLVRRLAGLCVAQPAVAVSEAVAVARAPAEAGPRAVQHEGGRHGLGGAACRLQDGRIDGQRHDLAVKRMHVRLGVLPMARLAQLPVVASAASVEGLLRQAQQAAREAADDLALGLEVVPQLSVAEAQPRAGPAERVGAVAHIAAWCRNVLHDAAVGSTPAPTQDGPMRGLRPSR